MADDLGFNYPEKTPSGLRATEVDALRPGPRRGLAARLEEIGQLRERDQEADKTAVFTLGIGAAFCVLMFFILVLAQPRGSSLSYAGEPVEVASLTPPPVEEIWRPAPSVELASLADLPPALQETIAELETPSAALAVAMNQTLMTLASSVVGARGTPAVDPVLMSPVASAISVLAARIEPELLRSSLSVPTPRSAPSVKPSPPASTRSTPQGTTGLPSGRTPSVQTLPQRLPQRTNDRASAGRAVIDLVGLAGEIMPEAANRDLGARVLRTLETAAVGGQTDFVTPEGRRGKLYAAEIRTETRERLVRRDARIARLPKTVRVEAGWLASDTVMQIQPSMSATGSAFLELPVGTPVERLASMSDAYGERWYLVGSEGVGVGYVPAEAVVPAEFFSGPLGDPQLIDVPSTVLDPVSATTDCRGLYVQLEGIDDQGSKFCREASGDWRAEGYGAPAAMPVARNVERWSGTGPVGLEDAAVEAIYTDSLAGDDGRGVELERAINAWLTSAPVGRAQTLELSDGTLVTATLAEPRDELRSMTIARNAEVMPLPSGMRFEAGWLEALDAVSVRAVPAQTPGSTLSEINAGRLVAKLAMYESAAGGSWYLIGQGGVGVGFVPMTAMALANAGEPDQEARFQMTKTVRDQVRAGVQCRDMVLKVGTTTRHFSGCQAAEGRWILERDLGGWLDVLPMATRAN